MKMNFSYKVQAHEDKDKDASSNKAKAKAVTNVTGISNKDRVTMSSMVSTLRIWLKFSM